MCAEFSRQIKFFSAELRKKMLTFAKWFRLIPISTFLAVSDTTANQIEASVAMITCHTSYKLGLAEGNISISNSTEASTGTLCRCTDGDKFKLMQTDACNIIISCMSSKEVHPSSKHMQIIYDGISQKQHSSIIQHVRNTNCAVLC